MHCKTIPQMAQLWSQRHSWVITTMLSSCLTSKMLRLYPTYRVMSLRSKITTPMKMEKALPLHFIALAAVQLAETLQVHRWATTLSCCLMKTKSLRPMLSMDKERNIAALLKKEECKLSKKHYANLFGRKRMVLNHCPTHKIQSANAPKNWMRWLMKSQLIHTVPKHTLGALKESWTISSMNWGLCSSKSQSLTQ